MSLPMSFTKVAHANNRKLCAEHPFFPMPKECMRCAFYAYNREHSPHDLAPTVYPELPNMTCGSKTFRIMAQTSMRYAAPQVNSSYLSTFKPKIISETFFSKECPPPIPITPQHDHYPERLALSPRERQEMFAGSFYTDALALSPVERSDSEEDAEHDSELEMREAPVTVSRRKQEEKKSSKQSLPLRRRSNRRSTRTGQDYKKDSDIKSRRVQRNVDKKIRGKSNEDPIIVDEIEIKSDNDAGACPICQGAVSESPNEVVSCDGCNLAAHRKCYRVPVTPEGHWLCKDCCPQEAKGKQKITRGLKRKRERDSEDEDQVLRRKRSNTAPGNRTRNDSAIADVSDDSKEEQKSGSRVAKRKRNSKDDIEVDQDGAARPSKRTRQVDTGPIHKSRRGRVGVSKRER